MSKLTLPQKIISIICQIIAAFLLGAAGYSKLVGNDMGVLIFDLLNIPNTRLIIGIVEIIAALLLLTRSFPQYGAILGLSNMIGATIAHISVLGIEVGNDEGLLLKFMIIITITTLTILWIHRKNLPLIGDSFK